MNVKELISQIKNIPKISVNDPDHAADEIVPGILSSQVLYFDNKTPVIKMQLHYQRVKSDGSEALIFNLLDKKSQMMIPNKQIKEALKRLCYASKLQIDLTEEFWRGQMYVNLAHGVYDIFKQKLVPVRNEYKFDYVINIRYIANSKLEDAPVFKKY